MAKTLHFTLFLALLCLASASLNIFQETYNFAQASNIPVDSNFTVSTFTGDWNVVALYGFPQINNRTCPTLNVKKTVTTSLAFTLESINYNTSSYDVIKRTYQPNPLNKGVLLYVLDPVTAQSLAVSYYNDTLGQALLINMNSSFALALSKSENIYSDAFLETVNDIFNEVGLNLNETNLINHYGCTTNYTSTATLNVSALPGTFYGNAIYTVSPLLAGLSCYNIQIEKESEYNEIYNITQYLQYSDFSFNISSNYAPSPVNEGLLINIDNDSTASLVINYYDAVNDAYILLAHDGTYAFVISSNQTLDQSAIDSIKNILSAEGLNVTDETFIVASKTCEVSSNNFESLLA